eukprot:COSAG02_NODE_5700_length_4111_cov_4.206176_3_plen_348_part_00
MNELGDHDSSAASSLVPTMLKVEHVNRHGQLGLHATAQVVKIAAPTKRRTPQRRRPSSAMSPRQLSRQIASSGVAGFDPPGRPSPAGAWPAKLQPGCGGESAGPEAVAPLRLLGCGAARRADGMLPAGIAYSRPAAARARQAAAARQLTQHNQSPPETDATSNSASNKSAASQEHSTHSTNSDERSPGAQAYLSPRVPKEESQLTIVDTPHSYTHRIWAQLGLSPRNWRDIATPRPGQPVEAGELETICVVEPSPPRRPGDPPRQPGDAMSVTTRHGAHTTGHLGFLAHTPRGECPPLRLDGKASRGRRGIANGWEREFRGAASVLRAGLVPLESTLRQRQWEAEAC